MAKYHEFLKYHEDATDKHEMTKEEIDFLLSLQEEMNTQDHVSQADPRYWVIKGTEKIYHVDDADGFELYDSDCCDTLAEDARGICEYINENLLGDINNERLEGEEFTVEFEEGVFSSDKIVVTWNDGGDEEYQEREELTDIDEIKTWLEEQGYNYEVISYKIIPKIYENTMFLTQKDAENHLRFNDYHYSEDAHTYAMTSWRSRETEMLWKILQEVDWSKLKEGS